MKMNHGSNAIKLECLSTPRSDRSQDDSLILTQDTASYIFVKYLFDWASNCRVLPCMISLLNVEQ